MLTWFLLGVGFVFLADGVGESIQNARYDGVSLANHIVTPLRLRGRRSLGRRRKSPRPG